jgi:hypothetical protein
MCCLLAHGMKRLINKEIFIQANIEGENIGKNVVIPNGLGCDEDEIVNPKFRSTLALMINTVLKREFGEDERFYKNLLLVLFFYRLESLSFYSSLQFELGTKDYLMSKFILDDILHVASNNPLLFIKVSQNVFKVKFSTEFIRVCGIDKYSFISKERPIDLEDEDDERMGNPMEVVIHNKAPINVRERMYFLMAK